MNTRIKIGRLLLLVAIILSIKIAFMIYNEVNGTPVIVYAIPLMLYLPVTLTILMIKTFKLKMKVS